MHDARVAWHLGDILSIVTGYDVSPRGEEGYEALEQYLADRRLTEDDRVSFAAAFRDALLAQYPELAPYRDDMPIPDELVPEWLRRRVAEFGEFLPVRRLSPEHPARRPEHVA